MNFLLVFVQGALIGIANIIPGVSGGTFALVLGIYERLLRTIGAFGLRTIQVTWQVVTKPSSAERRTNFVAEIKKLDPVWLGCLLLGAAAAILASSRLMTFLLDAYLSPTLAFFIGLIIPSIAVPYRLLQKKGLAELLCCLIGVGGLVCLTLLPPSPAGQGFGLVGLFVAGVVAISAMILPGISGSFMLMIMGEYKNVLSAINTVDLAKLGVFAAGCIVGIALFVRLLNFLLAKFHSLTMSFLLGLIVGSLWVLWPFKVIPQGAKITAGQNVMPVAFDGLVAWSIGFFVLGLILSYGVVVLGRMHGKE